MWFVPQANGNKEVDCPRPLLDVGLTVEQVRAVNIKRQQITRERWLCSFVYTASFEIIRELWCCVSCELYGTFGFLSWRIYIQLTHYPRRGRTSEIFLRYAFYQNYVSRPHKSLEINKVLLLFIEINPMSMSSHISILYLRPYIISHNSRFRYINRTLKHSRCYWHSQTQI
jgi:hypothetical protein